MAGAANKKVRAVQAVNKNRNNRQSEREGRDKQSDRLCCTFEDAEHNNLLTGIRMSTRGKIELFEEMLDFAWKTGAVKRPEDATASQGNPPATAGTASKC